MHQVEQLFFNDLEKKLWTSANKLLPSLDAAVYKHDCVLRDFTTSDIWKVVDTFHVWQKGEGYENTPGFCKSAGLDEVRTHDHVLTPGRYVGVAEEEYDGEPFAEKMAWLTAQLKAQLAQSAELEERIRRNLAGLGYEL